MTLVYELIFLVLVPASLFDLWQYRVPNALCFAALVISLIGKGLSSLKRTAFIHRKRAEYV